MGTARTRIGSSNVATVVPATFQLALNPSAASAKPSTWLPESPLNTAAARRGRRVEGGRKGQVLAHQAARGEDPDRDEDREKLPARVGTAGRDRDPEAGEEADEDADASEHGRRPVVPAVLAWRGREPARQGGAQK